MDQLSFPVNVEPRDILRKKSLGAAIELCAELGGFEVDKQLLDACNFDKAQFSRWQNGQEGVTWEKLNRLMDVCGNDAPLLWMLCQRGYDIASIRRKETELQRDLRLAHERIGELEKEREITFRALREVRV